METILFIDMLGAGRRWLSGGVAESMPAFFRFKTLVKSAVLQVGGGEVIDGGIENDSAMLVCGSTVTAAKIAQLLFLKAFTRSARPPAPRDWYRGCIVPHTPGEFLRVGEPIHASMHATKAYRYSESALEAISVEKSGFKGMRLLVKNELVTQSVKDIMRISFDTHSLIPFKKLNYSRYPDRVTDGYTDYMWMACQSEDEWHNRNLQMGNRLRYAGLDNYELEQAAATQLVFNECAAIRKSVISRARRASRAS